MGGGGGGGEGGDGGKQKETGLHFWATTVMNGFKQDFRVGAGELVKMVTRKRSSLPGQHSLLDLFTRRNIIFRDIPLIAIARGFIFSGIARV